MEFGISGTSQEERDGEDPERFQEGVFGWGGFGPADDVVGRRSGERLSRERRWLYAWTDE